jgi:hypothetical protein
LGFRTENKTSTSDGKGTFGILVGFLANYKVLMTFKGNWHSSVIYKEGRVTKGEPRKDRGLQ